MDKIDTSSIKVEKDIKTGYYIVYVSGKPVITSPTFPHWIFA